MIKLEKKDHSEIQFIFLKYQNNLDERIQEIANQYTLSNSSYPDRGTRKKNEKKERKEIKKRTTFTHGLSE